MDSNAKKAMQLGEPHGTANAKLRKAVLFQLLVESSKNVCFHCAKAIESVNDLSLEHKTPWLDSDDPIRLFFDLSNIAFSHLACNVGAARKIRSPLSEAERRERRIATMARCQRRIYTPERRRDKYQTKGY